MLRMRSVHERQKACCNTTHSVFRIDTFWNLFELRLFHRGNRDASKRGKPCCSGIMHWNFLQCLDAQRVGMGVSTFEFLGDEKV